MDRQIPLSSPPTILPANGGNVTSTLSALTIHLVWFKILKKELEEAHAQSIAGYQHLDRKVVQHKSLQQLISLPVHFLYFQITLKHHGTALQLLHPAEKIKSCYDPQKLNTLSNLHPKSTSRSNLQLRHDFSYTVLRSSLCNSQLQLCSFFKFFLLNCFLKLELQGKQQVLVRAK